MQKSSARFLKIIIGGLISLSIFTSCRHLSIFKYLAQRDAHKSIAVVNQSLRSVYYAEYFYKTRFSPIKPRGTQHIGCNYPDAFEDIYTQDDLIEIYFVDGQDWERYLAEEISEIEYCLFVFQLQDLDRLGWTIYYPDEENKQDIVILHGKH